MAELQSQLSSLRAQAGSSVRRITAPEAGLYSAVVDGYENGADAGEPGDADAQDQLDGPGAG